MSGVVGETGGDSNSVRINELAGLFVDQYNKKQINKTRAGNINIGQQTTSDVVVRLRTQKGQDEWLYCHSHILIEQSTYFANRFSKTLQTCEILDSRYCIELYCDEPEFDYYVITLRLFYVEDLSLTHSVRNALGILQVAVRLGCDQICDACMNYLEAVPWEEAEEEDILMVVSGLGLKYMSVFSRLQPVDPTATVRMLAATLRFASSSLSISLCDLKSSAQDQIDYMLTKDGSEPDGDGDGDDDVTLLTTNDMLKFEVRKCVDCLVIHFNDLVASFWTLDAILHIYEIEKLKSSLSDLSWGSQILSKMDMMRDLVSVWDTSSFNVVKAVEILRNTKKINTATMLKIEEDEEEWKVIRVVCMVLEAISYGNVILPTSKRLFMVKIWLPFVRKARVVSHDYSFIHDDNTENNEINTNTMSRAVSTSNDVIWQCIESAFISIIVTLPSEDQADIMAEWLRSDHVRYPDLTEAFELWCHRSKIARKRLPFFKKKDGQ